MKSFILRLWAKSIKKMRGYSIVSSHIDKTSKIESGSNIVNVTMDKYSFCGYDCEIVNTKIGSFCSIANNVKIGGARHPIEWACTSPVFYNGRDSVTKKFSTFEREKDANTIIGNDVWIGANAIIIQGVKIGNGAVIGAGSIVTKNVGDYEIVAGNPARLIRNRFDDSIIRQLIQSEWWDLSDDDLQICAPFIKEPQEFLKVVKELKNR